MLSKYSFSSRNLWPRLFWQLSTYRADNLWGENDEKRSKGINSYDMDRYVIFVCVRSLHGDSLTDFFPFPSISRSVEGWIFLQVDPKIISCLTLTRLLLQFLWRQSDLVQTSATLVSNNKIHSSFNLRGSRFRRSCLGASTYDVCIGRGRGRGYPKADESTDKLRECDSDSGGYKNPKQLQASYVHAPSG